MNGHSEDEVLPCLDELAELARTAGARVVARVYQRRQKPEAGTYLGSGKLAALAALGDEVEATVVISDDDLTPAQVRNLEEVVKIRVLDRSELIIDIFGLHARTQQSRLQVELAQLQYQAPRLKRMWTHLSRITGAGGLGSRGPGEKQIEVDRRIVRARIDELKSELAAIEARRDRQVRGRESSFNVALVGYTNAGKSTLMNVLTGADVFVADMLFATLDTRTRKLDVGDGTPILLSDTVGFIDKLPHHLVASFHATLAEVTGADLLLHVVDASDANADQKLETVRAVLKRIDASAVPELIILNKVDLVEDQVALGALRTRVGEHIIASAVTGLGIDDLRHRIRAAASAFEALVDLRIPGSDGRALARVSELGRVISRTYDDDVCVIRASLPRAQLHHFERFFATPSEPKPE